MMKVRLSFSGRESPIMTRIGLVEGAKVSNLLYREGEAIDLDDVQSAIKLMSNFMEIDNVAMEVV